MPFRKFNKIYRLGKEEVEGILEGTCYLEEKIDGANTSIWFDNNQLQLGSRNRHLIDDPFNGFDAYVDKHEGISELFHDLPKYHLYGEWLVRHTIHYNEENYKKWYLYDIIDTETNEWLSRAEVAKISNDYDLNRTWHMDTLENPTIEQLKEYVGKSALGKYGEGIVIKNPTFINRWGDRCYAKLVRQEFLEANAMTFNSNNKASEYYWETHFIHKYITEARLEKILHKLAPEINERWDMKHIPRIINTVYYDTITEESWELAKLAKPIDFKKLKEFSLKKTKILYIGYLEKCL